LAASKCHFAAICAPMRSKREVLAQLSCEELIAVVERFELEVADRRKKDDLLEAVASSKKATLANFLPDLSRERLRELCVGLGLDYSGREKVVLIVRLVRTGKAQSQRQHDQCHLLHRILPS